MKSKLLKTRPRRVALAAAFTALTALPNAALAQSNITLYGIVDAGFVHTNHVATKHLANNSSAKYASRSAIQSSVLAGSRWGLRGTESLGQGLSALFQLESGMNIANGHLGQGGRAFGRKAVIGLKSEQMGEVTIGRQYDPTVNIVQGLTGDGFFGGFSATPGDVDNYDNSMRVDNAVRYATPSFGGVTMEAMYAAGGLAGHTGSGRAWGFGAAWESGPFGVAAGYLYADGGRKAAAATGLREWDGTGGSLFNSVINRGFRSAKSVQIAKAAAKYKFGGAIVGVSYSNATYDSDQLSSFAGKAIFDSASMFASYAATPAINVGMGYTYTRQRGGEQSHAHYHQVNAGAVYSLSKRTATYVLAGWQRASGKTRDVNGETINAQASVGSFGLDAGTNTQLLIGMGVKHSF